MKPILIDHNESDSHTKLMNKSVSELGKWFLVSLISNKLTRLSNLTQIMIICNSLDYSNQSIA